MRTSRKNLRNSICGFQMRTETVVDTTATDNWELDEAQLDQIRGGQSGPAWDLLWVGGDTEESR
jgi:hypothetical protein